MNRTIKTELYEMDSDHWYITLEKMIVGEDNGEDNGVYYTIKKEHSDDGRSRSSIQLDEEQMNILIGLMKEIMKEGKK